MMVDDAWALYANLRAKGYGKREAWAMVIEAIEMRWHESLRRRSHGEVRAARANNEYRKVAP